MVIACRGSSIIGPPGAHAVMEDWVSQSVRLEAPSLQFLR